MSWANGSNAVLSGHDYTLDAMNRREAALRQDGSKWNYGYNLRGEVTSAAKEDAPQIPEPGKQYGFAFDGLGNRSSSTVSSLADNEVLRSTGYTTNAVNQYTQITHPQPGWLVLRGSANTAASVSIDGDPPLTRVGPLWHYETSVDNSSGPVRRLAEITATRPDGGLNNGPVTAKRQGAMFIPSPTESPTYDLDGNQTADARWNYAWNGENRLILAEEKPVPTAVAVGVSTPSVTTRHKLEFTYDAQGRRLTKKVYEQRTTNNVPGTFILKQSLVFLYDGWNMIAEIDTTTSARLIRSYEWGLDVSGTMDGAGGVGGLLVLREHPSTGAYAPCYDGNGNMTELVNLATGGVSARYEYGAFGETISVDGDAIADANPIRFSTKYTDVETGWVYYGYRYYSAELGRFASRDPIGERGGINLYGFVENDPVNRWDYLGLTCLGSISVSFSNSYTIPDQSVWVGGVEYPKASSGRQFSGMLRAFDLKGEMVFSANVISGGNREPHSRVTQGDDTSTPSGTYRVETEIRSGKIGFLVLNVPGRSAVEIHMNGVTTGCIAMVDNWDLMQQHMSDTHTNGTKTVKLQVWYDTPKELNGKVPDGTDPPRGNTGNGSGDPGAKPGHWPELPH